MGNKVRGVVVSRRETDPELNGSVQTLRELKAMEGSAEVTPVAQRAERVKEYREKRKERVEEEKGSHEKKSSDESSGNVIRKPYVVGVGGLKEVGGRLGSTIKAIGEREEPVGSVHSLDRENRVSLTARGRAEFTNNGKSLPLYVREAAPSDIDSDKEKPKEIAFFSEPKRVKKKTQRSIFIFQSAVCAAVCLIMLISRLAVPQLYENLHIYLTRLFGC